MLSDSLSARLAIVLFSISINWHLPKICIASLSVFEIISELEDSLPRYFFGPSEID